MAETTVLEGVTFNVAKSDYSLFGQFKLADKVTILTNFSFTAGDAFVAHQIKQYQLAETAAQRMKSLGYKYYPPGKPTYWRFQDLVGKLESTLKQIKTGLVLAATPTYIGQIVGGCVLKATGFDLVHGKCYPNPIYQRNGSAWCNLNAPDAFNCKDKYQHWIHLWVKDLGGETKIGNYRAPVGPSNGNIDGFPSCCGLKLRQGDFDTKSPAIGSQDLTQWVTIAHVPTNQLLPEGWRRIARYDDYKLAVNFTHPDVKGVQDCPHNYDIKIFDDWKPDASKSLL